MHPASDKLIKLPQIISQFVTLTKYFNIGIIVFDNAGKIVYIDEKNSHLLKKNKNSVFDIFRIEESEFEKIRDGELQSLTYLVNGEKIQIRISIVSEKRKKYIIFLVIDEIKATAEMDNRLNFLSIISHEFRTPITVIENIFDLFGDKIVGPLNEKQDGLVSVGKNNVGRLLKMLNDLLDVAKMEHERIDLNFSSFDFKEMLAKIISENDSEIKKKSLIINIDVGSDQINIFGDEHRIKQSINNIVGNAIKFTSYSTEVKIRTTIISKNELEKIKQDSSFSNYEKYLLFECRDQGAGIMNGDFDKIFGVFGQLEELNTRKYTGQGVGLSIAKYFVERHFGYVWVKSELGKGSTFTVILPVLTNNNQLVFALTEKIASASFYGYPLSIISVDISFLPKEAIENGRGELLFILAKRIIEKILFRSYDFVHYDSKRGILYVTLVNCTPLQASSVAERICKTINTESGEIASTDTMKVSLLSYPQDGTTVNELIQKSLKMLGRNE